MAQQPFSSIDNVKQQAEQTAQRGAEQAEQGAKQAAAHPWVEKLARLGYITKGVVYVIIGVLAAQVALGVGGDTTDPEGALREIFRQPFGIVLLGVVALGLFGYAIWRILEGVADLEHKGREPKGIAERLGYVGNGAIYLGLAYTAVRIIMGLGSEGGNSPSDWSARAMAHPLGVALVALAGAFVIGIGLFAFYEAYSASFLKKFNRHAMSDQEQRGLKWIGRFGLSARGVVFSIIGGLLILAAFTRDPERAEGPAGALATLAQQPFGPWLLGIVAFGLVAYGAYYAAMARYR